jgi:hypothetical protein
VEATEVKVEVEVGWSFDSAELCRLVSAVMGPNDADKSVRNLSCGAGKGEASGNTTTASPVTGANACVVGSINGASRLNASEEGPALWTTMSWKLCSCTTAIAFECVLTFAAEAVAAASAMAASVSSRSITEAACALLTTSFDSVTAVDDVGVLILDLLELELSILTILALLGLLSLSLPMPFPWLL